MPIEFVVDDVLDSEFIADNVASASEYPACCCARMVGGGVCFEAGAVGVDDVDEAGVFRV